MSRRGKTKHPVLSFFLPFPAGMGLCLMLAFVGGKLPRGIALMLVGAVLAAAVVLWSWTIRRKGQDSLELFAFTVVVVTWLMLGVIICIINDPINIGEMPPLFLGIAVGIGLLGGGICLWMTDLEWRYGRGHQKRSVLTALLMTALVAYGSFQLGAGLLLGVNRKFSDEVSWQATAIVEGLREKGQFYSRFTTLYSYRVTVTGEELPVPSVELKVSQETYTALTEGDRVQVLFHPGALGIPWLECVPLDG